MVNKITIGKMVRNGIGIQMVGNSNYEISVGDMVENGVAFQHVSGESIIVKFQGKEIILPRADTFSEKALTDIVEIIASAEISGVDPKANLSNSLLWKEWLSNGANAATLLSLLAQLILR